MNLARRTQLRQPRLAEVVAGDLRERIVTGVLEDGATIPKQEQLLAEFRVSPPVVREALRILENEGLVTVLRGKVGGAIVHRPQAMNMTHMLALVLRSRRATLRDVNQALCRLEGACAELCSIREDRETTVLPRLRATMDAAADAIDDPNEYTRLARQFHADIADTCGNETMTLVVGAVEALWSAHVDSLARQPARYGAFVDIAVRKDLASEHERIYRLIGKGDARGSARAVREHLTAHQDNQRSASYEFDIDRPVEADFVPTA
jgi:GntR family transcriptional repressor for pyruvate dehydrogenase complex